MLLGTSRVPDVPRNNLNSGWIRSAGRRENEKCGYGCNCPDEIKRNPRSWTTESDKPIDHRSRAAYQETLFGRENILSANLRECETLLCKK
jgi:hypothetical protein